MVFWRIKLPPAVGRPAAAVYRNCTRSVLLLNLVCINLPNSKVRKRANKKRDTTPENVLKKYIFGPSYRRKLLSFSLLVRLERVSNDDPQSVGYACSSGRLLLSARLRRPVVLVVWRALVLLF